MYAHINCSSFKIGCMKEEVAWSLLTRVPGARVPKMRLKCHTATACQEFLGSLNMGVDGVLSLSKYC